MKAKIYLLSITALIFVEGGNSARAQESLLDKVALSRTLPSSETSEGNPSVPQNLEWDQYLTSIDFSKLQPQCRPMRLDPPAGVPVKSKMMLVHGFTACPQQYFELAQHLNKQGVVVYLFLLPGHGRLPDNLGQDDFSQLPSYGDVHEYQGIAGTINKVAAADYLPSSIGGLSLGAVIALRAAQVSTRPYENVLVISPFFEIADYWKRMMSPGLSVLPMLNNKVMGWGRGCDDEAKRGRAGICHFTLSQIHTSQKFGQQVAASAKPLSPSTRVQFVAVEKDPAAYTIAMKKTFRQLRNPKISNRLSMCFYPQGASHSLLSRFDSPDQNKYWLISLLRDSTAFATEGFLFPITAQSQIEKGYGLCDLSAK